ncbi:hypothetical protein TKK_0011754 [Trichogramma kaykai]|uniref:Ubiquitin thioesterase OTU n=1 Tax=Trichogramma kaykai TaxID=54128 RepID=A0ABD2WQB1_9HYME
MGPLVLRVKCKSGQKILESLSPDSTLDELKVKLCQVTGIKTDVMQILQGYPPKAVDTRNDKMTLKECNISSGETIIVEEKQNLNNEGSVQEQPRKHITEQANFGDSPGILMKMVVPADDSCLFTSIGFVLNGKVDTTLAKDMRQIIVNAVSANPEVYNEAYLGKTNKDYCEWISKSTSWGGAIELAILSEKYGVEIVVVDSSNGIINRFGEDCHYATRVFLIFDGIHYDPLYMESMNGDVIQSVFLTEDEAILGQAMSLAQEAKSSHQYTDVKKFTLRCMECDCRLTGSEAAHKHALDTKHQSFGEIV